MRASAKRLSAGGRAFEALARANAAPRCGARSKRTGKRCRAAAMPNGRCKVHGGKSTGTRTPEGLERSRRANWKHGYYSREAKAERLRVRAAMLVLRYLRDSTYRPGRPVGCGCVCIGCTKKPLEKALPKTHGKAPFWMPNFVC
jgi:hypothetical protein